VTTDPDARVWAKTGAAALRTGNLEVASNSYLRLAAEDPTRTEEAAEGLDAVARAADRAGDVKRLESAVVGLGMIAPGRSIGRYALELIRRPGAEATDLVAVFPGAIAAAPDPETVDSLLAVYGAALKETSGCDQALPVFQATLRRTRVDALRNRAEEGVAGCSLALGLRAEAAGKPSDAALWFAAAIRVDSGTPVGRLSAGQRRRTALAALVARRPELWLLDEPHAGLDADGVLATVEERGVYFVHRQLRNRLRV
jgi:hypothetical protein